jgi:alanine racemase
LQQLLRPTHVKIHLDHVENNFEVFKKLPSSVHFLCPMVKANGYGHGDVSVTKKLTSIGCKNFGVGLVEEGLGLRLAGITTPNILVFGFVGIEAVQEMHEANLIPVVSDWEQFEALKTVHNRKALNVRQPIHIKINTGMNRLGFTQDEVPRLAEYLKQHSFFNVIGCGTHLMTSEDLGTNGGSSYVQLTAFHEILKTLNLKSCAVHAYNSGGAIHMNARPEIAQQFPYGFRIGLGLYGYSPVATDLSPKLYPAMSFISRIVTVQNVKKNGRVSYGGTWTAKRETTVGVVPAGYADGIPTQLSNKGVVQVGSVRAPIIGRVCMDYTLVDVTDVAEPLGKDVEFFGTNISAQTLAEHAGTITWDILTRVSERVPRLYFGE